MSRQWNATLYQRSLTFILGQHFSLFSMLDIFLSIYSIEYLIVVPNSPRFQDYPWFFWATCLDLGNCRFWYLLLLFLLLLLLFVCCKRRHFYACRRRKKIVCFSIRNLRYQPSYVSNPEFHVESIYDIHFYFWSSYYFQIIRFCHAFLMIFIFLWFALFLFWSYLPYTLLFCPMIFVEDFLSTKYGLDP